MYALFYGKLDLFTPQTSIIHITNGQAYKNVCATFHKKSVL